MIIEKLSYEELENYYKNISELNKKYVKEIGRLTKIEQEHQRINGELRVENEKLQSIIEKLEEHLLKMYEEFKDSECEENYTIAMQCMYIYNYLQELKEN